MRQNSRVLPFLFVSVLTFMVFAPVAHSQTLPTAQGQPTMQQPGPWDLGTRPSNWQATSVLSIENKCQGKHLFDVLTENISFLHFLAETKNVNVAGHSSQTLPIQFNASGMQPGDYTGQVVVKCLDCVQEPTCKQDREVLPVHLMITPSPSQPAQPNSPSSWSVTPGEIIQAQEPPALKPGGPQQYFLPVGMEHLEQSTLKWLASPFPAAGVLWRCCCCCQTTPQQAAPAPAPGPTPKPALSVMLTWNPPMVVTYVPATPINPAGYSGEAHVQWNASSSGSSGQITVDLEVQRPGSTRWESLASGRGPSDQYLFAASAPGTYLFRATAKDSSGASGWNTLSITFPRI